MGELTASLAHEINQPITGAITNANPACDGLIAISQISMKCARLSPEL
jgi:hypothetical protein